MTDASLGTAELPAREDQRREPVLVASHIAKSYARRGSQTGALKDVSLQLGKGEILAFLGPNGAGKTTLIKILAGLLLPDGGHVAIHGKSPARHPGARRKVGVVLEGNRNAYWRLTTRENLTYFGVLHGMKKRAAQRRSAELIDLLRLSDKANTLVQQLSRGMQQRLSIGIALMHEPDILLLDEPLLGLDADSMEELDALLRQLATGGVAIMMTTHQLGFAERLAQRVAIIHDGRIVVDQTLADLLHGPSDYEFEIRLQTPPPSEMLGHLASERVEVDGANISIVGDATSVWRVLRALDPIPILSLQRRQATLDDIFKRTLRRSDP